MLLADGERRVRPRHNQAELTQLRRQIGARQRQPRALSPSANSLQLRTESSLIGLESPRRLEESRYCSSLL